MRSTALSKSPEKLKILIGYECSGAVRRAFRAHGFDAWSCDTQAARDDSPYHLRRDIWRMLDPDQEWDLVILHPPCTYLTNSAAWAFKDPNYEKYPEVGYHQRVKPGTLVGSQRRAARRVALAEVKTLLELPFPLALENPRGSIGPTLCPASQTIQPYEYGNDASKATCLWRRRGVPALTPTYAVAPRIVAGKKRWANQTDSGQNRLSPGVNRADDRSATYSGIASAIAAQWGGWLLGRALPDHHAESLLEIERILA